MRYYILALLSVFVLLPQFVAAEGYMEAKDMLYDNKTKGIFKMYDKEARVESIGRVLALDVEKNLPRETISERAYKVEECVMKQIDDKRYKDEDVMTVISNCIVLLKFN